MTVLAALALLFVGVCIGFAAGSACASWSDDDGESRGRHPTGRQ